jgi:hypothetical protein
MQYQVNWEFPLPRTHTGMLLGNGTSGLMVWGEKNILKITVGRADFWDHRGGMPWTEKQNYYEIKKCLEANDKQGIHDIFAPETEGQEGQPARPSVLPVGRVELDLGEGAELETGALDLKSGFAKISYRKGGKALELQVRISMSDQVFAVNVPGNSEIKIVRVPVWDILGEYLSSISFEAPEILDNDSWSGWLQKCPVDPALCLGYKCSGEVIWFTNLRDNDCESLKQSVAGKLNEVSTSGWEALADENNTWWGAYWKDIPEIDIPNDKLDFIYSYGLYKFAGLTNPTGIAATLQGPWIEDYQMPPWSSDYHFNINVQMCYWPAYKANRLEHLMPLFDLIWSWKDKLRANAKAFIGVDDGFILPHAVDDRCTCMGSFWTGTIDHACTAWVAQMMYDYVKYSGNIDFLKNRAYPFMKGAMRVYDAMMEKDGDSFCLPVSVSPEYRGSMMSAWGKNASFQLASAHRLCENLIEASKTLGEKVEGSWLEIAEKLPKATLFGEPGKERIALWEDTDLEESHRHHSHLASITPFDSIDIEATEWSDTVTRSIDHWIYKGPGLWSGWCVPWASMIHSRMRNADMAEMLLEIWEKVYTNQGHGTLHDCEFPGFTLMGACSYKEPKRPEVMQMDAGMGAIVAVQDMLLHSRRGVVYLFNGCSKTWKQVAFKNMLAEGGFLISAERKNNAVKALSVKSTYGGTLKLGNPWGNTKVRAKFDNDRELELEGDVLEINIGKNENCKLNPVS